MKILFVNTKRGFFGGVERYVHDTALMLREAGHTTLGLFESSPGQIGSFNQAFNESLVLDEGNEVEICEQLKSEGVKLAWIHKITNQSLLKSLLSNFQTMCTVHDHDYYCIRKHKYFPVVRSNCHLALSSVYCPICSGLVEKHSDGRLGYWPIDADRRIATLDLVKQCDKLLVMSEFMRGNLILNKFDESKIFKVYPVMPEVDAGPSPQNEVPAVLYVGQVIRGKGVDLLIKSMSRIRIDFRLKIVGKGNDEGYVRKLIKRHRLGDKIEIVGWSDDVGRYYRQCDVVVVPSRWQEPFGLVGVEAMAHGKPVVGFNVGGIGEWLEDGVNGYLVPARDTKLFGARVAQLLENRRVCAELGANGADIVKEKFGKDAFWTQLNELAREQVCIGY